MSHHTGYTYKKFYIFLHQFIYCANALHGLCSIYIIRINCRKYCMCFIWFENRAVYEAFQQVTEFCLIYFFPLKKISKIVKDVYTSIYVVSSVQGFRSSFYFYMPFYTAFIFITPEIPWNTRITQCDWSVASTQYK